MKLLLLDWGAYTQQDIVNTLKHHRVTIKQVSYCFGDKNHDDYFYRHFSEYVSADTFDAVFTVNFFPLVAQVCYDKQVKYLSWSYDNPLNVLHIEETLGYPTNYVFLFDRIQASFYQNQGFHNVYHLPLAVNPDRLNKLTLTKEEWEKYTSEITLVGDLYASNFNEILCLLDDYHKGYLKAVAEAQFKVYGYYLVNDILTDNLMKEINASMATTLHDHEFEMCREQLSYAMATNITREERLILLNLLSKRHQVSLYSREQHPLLSDVAFKGSAKYYTEMYQIFKASKINLNITLKILQSGMPLRALDVMGAGGFLLSNYQEELMDNFVPEKDLVLYTSIEDAVDKASFYLHHEDLRQTIAQNGHNKVCENFNYDKQLSIVFKQAGL
ncbi:MAG TPA: DUF3880 domain-containing protein [Lachnospiraceae bacterium]|nr:DUF3880 domain-containing protein [Lachnospiraceae bacterium]